MGSIERFRAVFGIELRALVALRIGLAVLLLADLGTRARELRALYTDAGVMPRALVDDFYRQAFVGLYYADGSLAWAATWFAVAAALALLLLVGRFTRTAAAGSWFLLTALQLRNPYVGNFGDEIFRLVLFWSMFLPLGAQGSLDARYRRGGDVERSPHVSVASAGLLLQIVLVYLAGALLKLGPDWVGRGTAIYYTLSQDWVVRPAGTWLLRFPELLEVVTRVVLVFEFLLGFALLAPWPRLRTAAVVSGWVFHLSLAATMRMGLFPWVIAVALVAFLPARARDRVGRSATPRRAVSLIAGLALAWVLARNAATVLHTELPAALEAPGSWLRLDQKWNMYAPAVPRADGWFVVPGQLVDHTNVDVTGRSELPTWDKPARLSGTHRSLRWALYEFRLRQVSWKEQRRRYAAWLCANWNAEHAGPKRLATLQLHFVDETTPEAYARPVTRTIQLDSVRCD